MMSWIGLTHTIKNSGKIYQKKTMKRVMHQLMELCIVKQQICKLV